AVPAADARLYLRGARARPRRAARDAHGRRPVPDGDHVHLGGHRGRRHADDPAQPGRTGRVLEARSARVGGRDAPREPEGSPTAETAARTLTRTHSAPLSRCIPVTANGGGMHMNGWNRALTTLLA